MRKPKKSVRELNSFERLTHGLSFRILVMIVFLTIFIALMILFVGVGMYFQTMLDEYRSVTCTYAKSINMMLDDDKMLAKTEQVIDIYDSLPEEIKGEWIPQAKISFLWKIYRIKWMERIIEWLRRLKRSI